MKSPTLSACMIVKNEEEALPVCLRSVRDHVDEIVVVDTGSTDRTVSVAESFGARIFVHPWEEHFSRHRNQSIGYASSDWVLIIDADEELAEGSGQEIRRLLRAAGEDLDAITAVVECPFDGGNSTARANSIRLFRKGRGIRYEGRVHNYLVGVKKAFCSSVRILHYGYHLEQKGMQRKFERTTRLLRMDIEDDPRNPRPHHFLAASYLSNGLYKEAAEEAQEAIRLFQLGRMDLPNCLWSLYIASSACLETGEWEKAEGLAGKGLSLHPDHLDSLYLLSTIAFRRRDEGSFRSHMKRYLEARARIEKEPSRFGEMVHNTFTSRWILHLFGGILFLEKGEEREAQDEFTTARAIAPDPFSFHFTLGRLLSDSGRDSSAVEELRESLRLKPEEPNALWAHSHVYGKLGRPAEQVELIERLLTLSPGFPNAHFQAGLAQMRMGRFEKARELFRQARALRPGDRRAVINEVLCLRGMARYEESLRVSQEARPASREEEIALLLNQGCCYYALGQEEQALDAFSRLAQCSTDALEPPVYLSCLFLQKSEILSCLSECDRLLGLLGMERAITLEKVSDLGALYLRAAERLAVSLHRDDLAAVCREIGLQLTNGTPPSSCPSPAAVG